MIRVGFILLLLSFFLYGAEFNPAQQEKKELFKPTAYVHIVDNSFSNEEIMELFANLEDGDSIEFDKSFNRVVVLPEGGLYVDKRLQIYSNNERVIFRAFNKQSPLFVVTEFGDLKVSEALFTEIETDVSLVQNMGKITFESVVFRDINSSSALIENFGYCEVKYSSFLRNSIDFFSDLIENSGKLFLESSLFYQNNIDGKGAIIGSSFGEVFVQNSTFGENKAQAITASSSSFLKISFSTITLNRGGVTSNSTNSEISNTIISNNQNFQCNGEIETKGNNIFYPFNSCKLSGAKELFEEDPQLIVFEKYDEDFGVYVVNHQSFAYGLGNNKGLFEKRLGFDQTGKIFDERITIGAYEVLESSYHCNEEFSLEDEVDGTLFVEEKGSYPYVFIYSINPKTEEIYCSSKVFVGDSKVIPFTLGTKDEYEIRYSLKEDPLLFENKKQKETLNILELKKTQYTQEIG